MLLLCEAQKYKVADWPNGYACRIPFNGVKLAVIASLDTDDKGITWEYVSVSLPKRPPTWDELKFIKMLLWEPEDEVMQFFPPQSEYVNAHKNCLHLWRPTHCKLPWRD